MTQAYQPKIYQILMVLMADGKEAVSNIAISKLPSKAGLDAKFKALERAENAYYQTKGQTTQQVVRGGNLVDKKSISQTLRDVSRKRLLDALGQAKLRLGNLPFDAEPSVAHLEIECFKKYQKVGKTFYNSQIAATVRWLSSSSSNQIHDRLHALIDEATDHGAASSPCIVPESPPATPDAFGKKPGEASDNEAKDKPQMEHADEFVKGEHSDKFTKTAASTENMELPKIPSFREFVSQKGRDRAGSSSKAESQPSGIRRKASLLIDKQGTTETSKKTKS